VKSGGADPSDLSISLDKMGETEGFLPNLFTFHSSLFTSNLGLSQSDKPKFEGYRAFTHAE
jgi:hypothetical protein